MERVLDDAFFALDFLERADEDAWRFLETFLAADFPFLRRSRCFFEATPAFDLRLDADDVLPII